MAAASTEYVHGTMSEVRRNFIKEALCFVKHPTRYDLDCFENLAYERTEYENTVSRNRQFVNDLRLVVYITSIACEASAGYAYYVEEMRDIVVEFGKRYIAENHVVSIPTNWYDIMTDIAYKMVKTEPVNTLEITRTEITREEIIECMSEYSRMMMLKKPNGEYVYSDPLQMLPGRIDSIRFSECALHGKTCREGCLSRAFAASMTGNMATLEELREENKSIVEHF